MSCWLWTVGVVVGLACGLPSTVRNWRRECAFTAQCQAEEDAKTEALLWQIAEGRD